MLYYQYVLFDYCIIHIEIVTSVVVDHVLGSDHVEMRIETKLTTMTTTICSYFNNNLAGKLRRRIILGKMIKK